MAKQSVVAASHFDRERMRHLQVNHAFAKLRTVIPAFPVDRKMSKHEILRGAIRYVHILEYILGMRDFSDLESVPAEGN
ncbi:hypothetical protein L596_027217 [Steinernema carpocapsae]|uniref:BHLH domain-containing protein n=1 Tax=Steinernema carpocapsae TaxID=34508 RepID=A0A4U5M3Q6_STECR|nr:hypothetical protein L596_027217 [Steinernema carpocapsae]